MREKLQEINSKLTNIQAVIDGGTISTDLAGNKKKLLKEEKKCSKENFRSLFVTRELSKPIVIEGRRILGSLFDLVLDNHLWRTVSQHYLSLSVKSLHQNVLLIRVVELR